VRAVFLALAVGLVCPTAFAASPGEASTALIKAENTWALHGPRSYEFTVRFHEFIYMYCTELTFCVVGDKIHVRKPPDCRRSQDPKVLGTIPRLLRYARGLLRNSDPLDTTADFRFDETTGVPYAFSVSSKTMEDAFSAFEVANFEVIAP
jgi:hypothetical protein